MNTLFLVREFHDAFDCPIHSQPNIFNGEVNRLRLKLLREEVDELQAALDQGDEEQVLDALSDIQYVLDGAYLALGFHSVKSHAFELVHKANMKKLGPDGKPRKRSDGKIIKPDGWQAPSMKGVLAMLTT